MTIANAYKIGFWIVTAVLIVVGAIIIGLLGAGKLSFGGNDKQSPGGFETLRRHGARFYLLTFNDVSAKTNFDTGAAGRTGRQYLEKMEYYLSDVESALKSPTLVKLLRVDVLNLQKNDTASAITVTALLAFDGGGANDTLSEAVILKTLDGTRNKRNSNWRDVYVTELKDLALPAPAPSPSEPTPPTTTPRPPQIPAPVPILTGRCENELVDYCVDVIDTKNAYYPNALGHESIKEVQAALGLFQMLDHSQCHPTIKNFTCLLLQPPCAANGPDAKALLPCGSYCHDVVDSCLSLLNGTYLEDASTRCDSLPMINCSQICLPEHFVCEISKLCLNDARLCNHRFECGPGDYSDERGCGCGDPNEEQCPSGQCISKSLFCNNKNDCGDWGDEVNCTCPEGYRRCTTTGQCFPERFWCNDEFDCDDKSDEKNCTCTASDFKCQNGYCLHPGVRCNGVNDCDDFSDEFNCECNEFQFRCDKYLCKNYINNWCNGRPDCDDGTDETANCTCKEYQFRCDNGQCIPIFEKCDGKPQCDDNSDELHCECTKHEFKCGDGQCIPSTMVCDGKFQCSDGSDERQNCTCPKGKFPCDDGACMPVKWWCDGNKECKNGEDEPENCKQTCPPNHPIRCVSWRKGTNVCVHQFQICNGHVLCKDGEDEHNCLCDPSFSFTCPGGNESNTICLPWSKYCDGVQDCPYDSEETNCKCDERYQFTCPAIDDKASKCISSRQKCNGIPDCPDGVDEANCTCGDVLRNRNPHRLCDGVPDCPDFSDEFHEDCEPCNATTHYLCNSGTDCILSQAVCDGIKDCPDGDDERVCLKLAVSEKELQQFWEITPSGVLYGRRKGKWAPVCAQDLNDKRVMEVVCKQLGFQELQGFKKDYDFITSDYMKISTKFDTSWSLGQNIDLPTPVECPSNEILQLSCDVSSIKCGQRPLVSETQRPRIAGGAASRFGAWPSYAALYENGELHCGTTIIDMDWVVTAAHCVFEQKGFEPPVATETSTPVAEDQGESQRRRKRRHAENIAGIWEGYRLRPVNKLVVRAGMIRNSSWSPFDQFNLVDAIIPHSMFNPKTGHNDIALLRLHSPLTYSVYVAPACIADRPRKLSAMGDRDQKQKCLAVGYGSLGRSRQPMSDELMEIQLPVKDTAECQRIPTINADQKIDRTELCAGMDDGSRDTCQGDSGGPLQCQACNNTQGVMDCSWWLFGVTSSGYSCGSLMTPGVYTKVSEFDEWINAVIQNFREAPYNHTCSEEAKFRCFLGNCMPEEKVCDKTWDCAFGEDEQSCP